MFLLQFQLLKAMYYKKNNYRLMTVQLKISTVFRQNFLYVNMLQRFFFWQNDFILTILALLG